MIPSTMKALVTTGDGNFQLKEVTVPSPGPHEILIKIEAVAQNPTDWKTVAFHRCAGNIIGCDFAGTVAKIGQNVPPDLRHLGERVASFVHGGISSNGSFAEYLVADAELVISIPDTWTLEQAAQLGIACYTACQSLYRVLNLPNPFERSPTTPQIDLLVWSGTSSVGQYVIQFAKLAGIRVVSTSSPGNFDFVRSLGADLVFDYADSKTAKKIFNETKGTLTRAVDCISEGMTPVQVSNSLSKSGGKIATLLPYQSRKSGVETDFVLAYSIFGRDITFPYDFPANPQHYADAKAYSKLISRILSTCEVKPNPIKLYSEGLVKVVDGFEYMRSGQVHAEKLTYKI